MTRGRLRQVILRRYLEHSTTGEWNPETALHEMDGPDHPGNDSEIYPRYVFITCPHCHAEFAWNTKSLAPTECNECHCGLFRLDVATGEQDGMASME